MSDDNRAIVPVSQHGVVASVGRRLEITEKLLTASPIKNEYTCPIMGAKFVFIPAGTFMMGFPEDEIERDDDETLDETLHQETISEPFYLQTTPVTQRQWKVVMGSNPSHFKGENLPVDSVSWDDVQEYIQKLNEMVGNARYRLPTEEEWEYAARSGGKAEKWAGTSDESSLGDYAWLIINSGGGTHSVGQKKPNSLGIYDMTGNVYEWCQDWCGVAEPVGSDSGVCMRIVRGGCCMSSDPFARAAHRGGESQNERYKSTGFRLAVCQEPLTDIQAELENCQRCLLWKDRTNLVFGAGATNAKLVFVGEAPGADEDQQGKPFVGRAGQLLTNMIKAMGFEREEVYLCNVLKCRPLLNRLPLQKEIEQCQSFLLRQIKAIRPDAIVALGTIAAQTLIKSDEPLSKLRGSFYKYHGIHVMPTYHPDDLLMNPNREHEVWKDVHQVSQLLGKIPCSALLEQASIAKDSQDLKGGTTDPKSEEHLNRERMRKEKVSLMKLEMIRKAALGAAALEKMPVPEKLKKLSPEDLQTVKEIYKRRLLEKLKKQK